jgi:hypothetical protein
MNITDDLIAAFADGELDGAEQLRVAAAVDADPALARKVALHRTLKGQLAAHYAPIAEQPVPAHLAALLQPADDKNAQGAEMISFAAARQKRGLAPMMRRWAPIAGPALAASLVLTLWQPWQGSTPDGYAQPGLAAALDTQLAGATPDGDGTRILLSFERDGGDLCRAWRGADEGGIACRDDTGWRIEQQFALGTAPSSEFRQAGSEADLLAAAQDMAAGEALDAEAERAARERGWRSSQ